MARRSRSAAARPRRGRSRSCRSASRRDSRRAERRRDGARQDELSGAVGRGSSIASRVPAPTFDSMSRAPLRDATRSRIPTSPKPPSAPPAWEKPRPSSSTVRATDRSRRARATRTAFASACLTTFVKASCVMRKMAVSSFPGSRVPAGRSMSSWTFGPPRASRRLLRSLRAGERPNSSSAAGRRENASRPTFSSALRALCEATRRTWRMTLFG
jgi:hypothetical protein